MFTGALKRLVAVGLLLLGGWAATSAPLAWGQDELNRKTKSKVAPTYPELARKMNITGVVKVQVTVAPNGSIKNTKVLGGHPILVDAVQKALKKWKYAPGSAETTTQVEFKF